MIIDESHHTASAENTRGLIDIMKPKITIEVSATPHMSTFNGVEVTEGTALDGAPYLPPRSDRAQADPDGEGKMEAESSTVEILRLHEAILPKGFRTHSSAVRGERRK